jgi:hypothetical protein
MAGGFLGWTLYPLQNQISYFSSSGNSNSTLTMIVLGGIAVVIVTALVIGFVKNGVSGSGVKKTVGGGAVAPRKFSGFALQRLGASYGLDRDQIKLLEFVFRNDGVTDPGRVLADQTLLDRHFKRAGRSIEENSTNDSVVQERLARLYALRNALEAVPAAGGTPGKISDTMAAVLFTGRDNFPVKVISSRGEGIVVENPRNALGTPIRIPKGSRVTLSFLTKTSTGFSYDSRVTGFTENTHVPGLQLALLGKAKPLAQRKFRRKQTSINCAFSFVFEEEAASGRDRRPKLVVDRRRFSGTVLDISVGGCSMKTSAAIRAGSRLKLEMDAPNGPLITCLGQVLRINKSGAMGMVIHIKFLKVPRRAFNTINALVFGYND